MGPSPDKCSFVFTNLAGGARKESCDPFAMGRFLATHPLLAKYPPVLIGYCECVRTGEGHLGADEQEQALTWSVPTVSGDLDDLERFVAGLREGDAGEISAAYLSVIDSRRYSNPAATAKKWGEGGSPRLAAPAQSGAAVHQGLGVVQLSPSNRWQATGRLIRVAGAQPASRPHNDPLAYDGTRDTEPRAAIVCRGSLAGQPLAVAFTQFETNSADVDADGRRLRQPTGAGHENRLHQAQRLAEMLAHDENTLILGDFNAAADTAELAPLHRSRILPLPLNTLGRPTGQLVTRESPLYTHLMHIYLPPIDLAWQRTSFNRALSACILQLPSETPGERTSDHRPIVIMLESPVGS